MKKYFKIKKESSDCLITAPHGGRDLLDGNLAPEPGDRGTDYLATLLAKKLNCSSVIAKYSRLVVDFNVPKERCVRDSFHLFKIKKPSKQETEERQKIYEQYYETLRSLIKENTLHLSLHSMYFIGPKGSAEEGKLRPDFRLGTQNFKTINKKKVKRIKDILKNKGYSVEVDNIFKGGEEVKKTSKFGASSLQIEINSNLLLKDDDCDYQDKEVDRKKIKKLADVLFEYLKK